MKALAIAMAAMICLFFILTESVQAQRGIGRFDYCKSGARVHIGQTKNCKENGGTR